MNKRINFSGFSLVEILTVIGLLGVLFSVTIMLINPQKNNKFAYNSQRESDISAILKAIYDYSADHDGDLLPGLTNSAQFISKGNLDICPYLFPSYINPLPQDPKFKSGGIRNCNDYDTGYQILKEGNNRVTVIAPFAEDGKEIKVTK